jgi:eukaryotic-like serine/threonine-protein kinase
MSFGIEDGAIFAGRYRVIRRLAAGAMGVVFEAVHLETDRRWALKVMLAHIIERPELRERFRLEARVTAHIASEHIVRVFDAGVDDATGLPFLVMELLHGEELGRCLRRVGRFSPAEALACLHQTALALDRTHAASIVHRDLKPGNLFLDVGADGEPRLKVLDFGVAKIVAESTTSAGATMTVGTPLYMAPEQFRGLRVSAATDIYALGMMAYTFLVGEAYWADEKREDDNLVAFALNAVYGPQEKASERATRRGVALAEGFDAWFARATAVEPVERFATATAAVRALGDVLGIDDIAACPLPRPALALELADESKAAEAVAGAEGDRTAGRDAATELDPGSTESGTAEPGETELGTGELDLAESPTSTEAPSVVEAPGLAQERSEIAPVAPASPSRPAPVARRVRSWRARLPVIVVGLLLSGAATAVMIGREPERPRSAAPVLVASPLASPASALACPVLEASGVEAPAGWLGAAAAATLCERARLILGGAAARTRVPAELLGLPREPVDGFPVDPFGQADAAARSLDAARRRAAAYVDGEVVKEASGFRVALVLRRPDGGEIGRGAGVGRALYQAVREAMGPLVGPDRIPRAVALDPEVAEWSRVANIDEALVLLDTTLAMAQNAGGLADDCARIAVKPGDAAEAAPVAQWLCLFTLGQPLPEVALARAPVAPRAEPSSPAALAARARARHMIAGVDEPEAVAEIQRLLGREATALGRSLLATTASCLLQSTDPKRAQEMAFLAVQADPKNPLGELCAPWGQLVSMSRDTASAESTTRAMQAWAPWDSSGWTMQALGAGDADQALAYARRSYALTPFDTNVADILSDKLLARGAREEARNIALALLQGGHPVHRLESDLLLVRVDASLARFGAALTRAERAMEIAPADAGWVRVQRLEVAWRAIEIGAILGRAAAIADLVVQRFIDPEPPPLEGAYVSVSMRIPAICARASEAVSRRCFDRFKALRARLSGGVVAEADGFADGAERWARGDLPGAARAWRPLLRQPGLFAQLLPDAMATTFERTGDLELVERLEAAALAGPGEFNGAGPAHVRAARRAAKRGDEGRAKALARQVIEAWGVADETVPAVAEMRRLLAGIR